MHTRDMQAAASEKVAYLVVRETRPNAHLRLKQTYAHLKRGKQNWQHGYFVLTKPVIAVRHRRQVGEVPTFWGALRRAAFSARLPCLRSRLVGRRKALPMPGPSWWRSGHRYYTM